MRQKVKAPRTGALLRRNMAEAVRFELIKISLSPLETAFYVAYKGAFLYGSTT
ncbi:hypothetical protein [Pseudomonas tohonis]|uniref:hypothetical protein n=1 Tax=Pseudomonas tohonis TaxID=2725477 RepID=UPI001F43E506|nr:hypothetical protein [Pseudomonas tohonis]